MCTEFILASIYFSIIFIINFLLVKLLLSYKKSLAVLSKLKKIQNFFEKKNLTLLLFLEKVKKKELKIFSFISEMKNFSDREDILIIGNIYKSFSKNKKKNSNNFYFLLLEQQYLFSAKIEK